MPKGRPKAFKTKEEFTDKFQEYLSKCEAKDHLPNVAGFCVFADIHKDTFYQQKEYYSDAFKKVQDMLEDGALNAKIPPAVKIFYMKNKFKKDYKDKQEIESTNHTTLNMERVSSKDLRKMLDD